MHNEDPQTFVFSFSLVHYPEDKKYTIKPLEVTHLAGRDPVTGRVVSNCLLYRIPVIEE